MPEPPPSSFLTMFLIALVEAKISVGRLLDFFLLDELPVPVHVRTGPVGVKVTNGTFVWDMAKVATPILSDVTLNVAEGQLVMIVGPVGAGKTSLLSAILGSMPKVSGQVDISGSVAYAPQQAWIMNDTVQNNILFGLPYNETRYRAAIHAACLAQDLEMLPV